MLEQDDAAGRGPAVRLARRPRGAPLLPGRRRVLLKIRLQAATLRLHPRHRPAAPARRPARRRAGQAVHGRRRGQRGAGAVTSLGNSHAATRSGRCTCTTRTPDLEVPVPGEGRHPRGRRLVRRARVGAGRRAAAAHRPASTATAANGCTTAMPADRQRDDRRPYNAARAGRHAEPPAALRLPPQRAAGRRARAPGRFSRRSRGAPIAGRSTDDDLQTLLDFYRAGRAEGALRRRHPAGRSSGCSSTPTSCSASNAIRRSAAPGAAVPAQRPRAGVAAVVLPLEQHSRRRAARRSPSQGTLREPAVLERAGAADAGRPRASSALVEQLRRPVAGPAQRCAASRADPERLFPDFDDKPARARSSRETELFFESSAARGPQRPRPADGQLHVRQRAAGPALRHPERLRQPLPPRDASDDSARRAARPGQHPDGHDLVPEPHVAGAARQVAAREHLLGTPPPPPPPERARR